MKVMKIWSSD